MNRLLQVFAAAAVLFPVLTCFAQSQGPAKKLFLLEEPQQHRWCAFDNEHDWNARVQAVDALRVATLEYTSDKLSKINVTEEDETGDWVVYDHYSIAANGRIEKIERTMNVIPSDLSEDDLYLIIRGKTTRQTSERKRLRTKEPIPTTAEEPWVPTVPIVTNPKDFPFSRLLHERKSRTFCRSL